MTHSTDSLTKEAKRANWLQKKKERRRKENCFIMNLVFILSSALIISGLLLCIFINTPNFPKKEAQTVILNNVFAEDGDTPLLSSPKLEVPITISIVGDCTLGIDRAFPALKFDTYYNQYGADYFFQNVKHIFESDDLTIANFEGTLTDSTARADKKFAFRGPAEYAKILTKGSIESVTLANNHSSDYGYQSFLDTKVNLDAEGITHFGFDQIAIQNVKGIKVGLIGIYELGGYAQALNQTKSHIAKAKAEGADIIIVIYHWGNEYQTAPTSHQTTLARLAIDEGADLVCGHHPHILQGIETYKGKNIVYSLGNFCFGGNSNPSDKDTMIFQQTFTFTKDGLKEDNVTNIIPCSLSSEKWKNNFQPTPATGDEATQILEKIRERSGQIKLP